MDGCPISPPPLFGIVPPDTPFYHLGDFYFGPESSTFFWNIAIVFVLVVGAISVATLVAIWRRTTGTARRNLSLLVAAGALVTLAPALFLLLVGWPGSYVDYNWWISTPETGAAGYACTLLYYQLGRQRGLANGLATVLSLLGGVFFLVSIINAGKRSQGTGSPISSVE